VRARLLNAARNCCSALSGSYSINNTMFGVNTEFGRGVVAFVLESRMIAHRCQLFLASVLGPLSKPNFTHINDHADGNLVGFFQSSRCGWNWDRDPAFLGWSPCSPLFRAIL